ncbi:MAG: protein-glutamate O-methyltransferase CheR [Deltaproteobacteria bacterium]|nr:protein-glutamate O-methyltransferase CheR [Candidatus Zymogenaceae bacterium]
MDIEGVRMVRDYVQEITGLKLKDEQLGIFSRKLAERISELGFETPFTYYLAVKHRYKDIELVNLIDKMKISETFFFREEEQLAALKDRVLPEIAQRVGTRTIRIWSAGCSTGEEAYTLAILCQELKRERPDLPDMKVTIIASDINEIALDSARIGKYSQWAIRHLPSRFMGTYVSTKNGGFEVIPELREMIQFIPINLNDVASWEARRDFHFDVVFCRNVLMYFSDQRVPEVVRGISHVLDENGYLFTASTESLMRHTTIFKPMKIMNTFVYKKRKT